MVHNTLVRRAELVALDVHDLEFLDDGVATTDLKAEQDFRFLSPRTTELVRDWLARSGLREGPLLPRMQCRRLRFLADAHLGALARRLRMLGFDTLWHNDLGDGPLARLAVAEHRILLTRDRQLLILKGVVRTCPAGNY